MNARSGGWYRVDVSRYDDRSGAFDFTRVDVDLRQFVSLSAERRVLSPLRLFAIDLDADAGAQRARSI